MISLLFGVAASIRILRSLVISHMVENRGDVVRSFLELRIIVDWMPIVNVLNRTIERFSTICKFFRDFVYESEIVLIDGSLCFPLPRYRPPLAFELFRINFDPQVYLSYQGELYGHAIEDTAFEIPPRSVQLYVANALISDQDQGMLRH